MRGRQEGGLPSGIGPPHHPQNSGLSPTPYFLPKRKSLPQASNRKSHSSLQNKSGDSPALLSVHGQKAAACLSDSQFRSSLFSLLTFLCRNLALETGSSAHRASELNGHSPLNGKPQQILLSRASPASHNHPAPALAWPQGGLGPPGLPSAENRTSEMRFLGTRGPRSLSSAHGP